MKITWLGHAAFLVETGGVSIVTDPYDESVGYGPITQPVDIATVSHDHGDHNYVKGLAGSPVTIKGPGVHEARGVTFRGIATYHDDSHGSQRGANTIFVMEIENLSLCHAGDLGHLLSADQVAEIGKVDILLLPVGGTYTTDARQATRVVEDLDPRLVIPMHFKTDVLDFPITGVEPFLQGKQATRFEKSCSLEINADTLPGQREIVVLDHLL